MFFNILGSEFFLGRRLGARIYLFILGLLVIHMATREMVFSNTHFYVRGESHFYWGAVWLALFLFWNCLHFFLYKKLPLSIRKDSRVLPFYTLNFSFILAATYSYGFGLYKNIAGSKNISNFCGGILSNFEIVFDAPSIWCVFATIQGFFLYRFGKRLFARKDGFKYEGIIPYKKSLIWTLVIWGVVFITLPIFSSLSYKMILK